MNRVVQNVLVVGLIALVVFLAGLAVWKTDQEWQITQDCWCGHNVDALFATQSEYFQAHVAGNLLLAAMTWAGVALLVTFRPLGYLVTVFALIVRAGMLAAAWNVSTVVDEFVRNVALLEVAILVVVLLLALAKDFIPFQREDKM